MTDLWRPTGKPYCIDISHHNPEPIDFAALADDGVKLVIHKSSQGNHMVDAMYAPRRKRALDAGLMWGAYHFCDSRPISGQLAHFLAASEPDDTMRLALDIEPNGSDTIGPAAADLLCGMLDDKRGQQCFRYTGAGYLTPAMISRTMTLRYGPIWLAKFGPQPTVGLLKPLGIDPARMVLWQFTEKGERDGITGRVDQSWWLGTPEEMDRYPALPASYPMGK